MAKLDRSLKLGDKNGNVTVELDGAGGNAHFGGGGANADIRLFNADGQMCVLINGGDSNIIAGGNGESVTALQLTILLQTGGVESMPPVTFCEIVSLRPARGWRRAQP